MNNVILIGRLVRDPELSYTPNQTAICKFDLAVDRPRRQGEESKADFLHIVVFGRQAENCNNFLAKGRQAGVQGRIEIGSYQNKDGIKVNTFDIIADKVEFLGRPEERSQDSSYHNYGDYSDAKPYRRFDENEYNSGRY